jgi:hypothetical protein
MPATAVVVGARRGGRVEVCGVGARVAGAGRLVVLQATTTRAIPRPIRQRVAGQVGGPAATVATDFASLDVTPTLLIDPETPTGWAHPLWNGGDEAGSPIVDQAVLTMFRSARPCCDTC